MKYLRLAALIFTLDIACRACGRICRDTLVVTHTLRLRGAGICLSEWMLHPALDLNESQRELNKRLWESAEHGDMLGINRTLQAGAEVNAPGPGLWTALHFAARYGHTNAVNQLISAGANLESRRFQTLSRHRGQLCECLLPADASHIHATHQTRDLRACALAP